MIHPVPNEPCLMPKGVVKFESAIQQQNRLDTMDTTKTTIGASKAFGRGNPSEMREAFRRIGDEEDRFDIDFWESQGERAIFEAALDIFLEYQILKYGHADKPRLQRAVESFQKA